VGAGGESHAADGHFQGAFAGIVKGAQFADEAGGYAGVVLTARLLQGAGPFDAGANFRGGFRHRVAAQLLERHRGHFHVDIDAVQERAADLAEIALNDGRGATALARGVAVEPARAPVQITTLLSMKLECQVGTGRIRPIQIIGTKLACASNGVGYLCAPVVRECSGDIRILRGSLSTL
jgi:hypothetical protein